MRALSAGLLGLAAAASVAAGCTPGTGGAEGALDSGAVPDAARGGEAGPDAHTPGEPDTGAGGVADAATDAASAVTDTGRDDAQRGADAAPPGDGTVAPDAQAPAPPEVVLNEIDCTGAPWVEVFNPTDAGVDIADWTLSFEGPSGVRTWTIPLGYFLVERGFLAWPGPREARMGFRFDFACGVDTVVLRRPDGTEVDRHTPAQTEANETMGRLPDGGAWQATAYTRAATNAAPLPRDGIAFDPWHPLRFDVVLTPEARAALEETPRTAVDAEVRVTLPEEATPRPAVAARVALTGDAGAFRTLDGKASVELTLPADALFGVRTVVLDNSVLDASMLRPWVAAEVARAAGAATARTGFGVLSIDGLDYGLYVTREPHERAARPDAAAVFSATGGVDLTPAQAALLTVVRGDPAAPMRLLAATQAIERAPVQRFAQETAGVLDWPALLPAFAADTWAGRRDGYVNGRRRYALDEGADGRLRVLPPVSARVFETAGSVHSGDGLLFQRCMADLACQGDYDLAVGALVTALQARDLPAELAALAARIAPWVAADPRRPYSARAQAEAAVELGRTLAARKADVEAQMACRLGPNADPDGDGYRCESDCAPNDARVNPGATDTCDDGLDQDCSGVADDPVGCDDCAEVVLGATPYWFCTTPRSWARAAEQCAANGAVLVRVESPEESAWLDATAAQAGISAYWTGLSEQRRAGQFRYGDQDLTVPRHFQWADGEPGEDDGGRCVVADAATSTWRAVPCVERVAALCQPLCFEGPDRDVDGADDCQLDCDPLDPAVRFGAPEVCGDARDQDCDGRADEGVDCDCRVTLHGGQRYGVCPSPRTQAEARATCQALNMDLVQLETAGEAAWLARETALPRAWVGLFRRFAEFTWLNDFPLLWSAWRVGEPAEAGECASAGVGLLDWAVVDCGAPLGALCEATCPRVRDLDGDRAPACGTDCDDGDPSVYAGAPERCADAVDQDCDGRVDEGCP